MGPDEAYERYDTALSALLTEEPQLAAIVNGDRNSERYVNALLMLLSVGRLETMWGAGWKGQGVGSNNHGAIQASCAPPCDDESFLYTDTSPNDDGTSTSYQWCYRRYDSPEEGIQDLAVMVFRSKHDLARNVLRSACNGDSYAFSAAMYARGYYEGFGATTQDRIGNHHKMVVSCLRWICQMLGKPMPGGVSIPPPTLRRGSFGEAVKDLQRMLGDIVADGAFGPNTEADVKIFQASVGLKQDGVVGPATWEALKQSLDDEDAEDMDSEATTDPAPPILGERMFLIREKDLIPASLVAEETVPWNNN